jgi:putative transcriptional regulator
MARRQRTCLSGAFRSIHASAEALHGSGVVDDAQMRAFDDSCQGVLSPFLPSEIVTLRKSANANVSDFAMMLNTSRSTVLRWECGASRPRGPALKLLTVISRHGVGVLT